jgi:hypothetical protein
MPSKIKALTEDFVQTPAGLLPKSQVHLIEPGHVLHFNGKSLQKLDSSRNVLADFGQYGFQPSNEPLMLKNLFMPRNLSLLPRGTLAPASIPPWKCWLSWHNGDKDHLIENFRAHWKVPSEPLTKSSQVIFIFNGIQNSDWILQPVLQWGDNGKFGGGYWVVASWYVSQGQAFHSKWAQISGDARHPPNIEIWDVTGLIELTGQGASPTQFDYKCEFSGIPGTVLNIQNQPELKYCYVTLEAYSLNKCSEYPMDFITPFTNIEIRTTKGHPSLEWDNLPIDYGHTAKCDEQFYVVNHKNPGSEALLFYRGLQGFHIPDLFFRYDVSLNVYGDSPDTRSPDIIIKNYELLNPEALAFPEYRDEYSLGDPVQIGQDNFIYFRVQNRGPQHDDGKIKAYWACPTALKAPQSWDLIDEINIPPILHDEFKVVGPIKWPRDKIPCAGAHCVIAIIEYKDNVPNPAAIKSYVDFQCFIGGPAACKSFDVVDVTENTSNALDFQICGLPDVKILSDLMIDCRLPSEAKVYLRILKRLTQGTKPENMNVVADFGQYRRYRLNLGNGIVSYLRNMPLQPSDKSIASIEFKDYKQVRGPGFIGVSVARIVNGMKLGSVKRDLILIGLNNPLIGNLRTKELHLPDCQYAGAIKLENKIKTLDVYKAINDGFNGCHYCMPEFDTG